MDATLRLFTVDPDNPYELAAGDVVGFSGHDCSGFWINLGTWGIPFRDLSHVAIVADHPTEVGRLILWESTSLYREPCLIKGVTNNGVQAHTIRKRVATYRGNVWRYPLAGPLTTFARRNLSRWLLSQVHVGYDYLGAWRARDLCLGKVRRWLIGEQNLASLFCSELVAAALTQIGRFEDGDASAWNPNSLCRELARRKVVTSPIRIR